MVFTGVTLSARMTAEAVAIDSEAQWIARAREGDRAAFEQLYRTDWAAIVSHTMPLIVLDLTDREMFEISLAENLKRADLSPIEKATALRRYMDEFGATSR